MVHPVSYDLTMSRRDNQCRAPTTHMSTMLQNITLSRNLAGSVTVTSRNMKSEVRTIRPHLMYFHGRYTV